MIGALLLMHQRGRGEPVVFPILLRSAVLTGAALVLASFTLDFQSALRQTEPAPFRWALFSAGVGLAGAALVAAVRRRA